MSSYRSTSNPTPGERSQPESTHDKQQLRPQIVRSATSARLLQATMNGSTTRLRSRSLVQPAAAASPNTNSHAGISEAATVGSSAMRASTSSSRNANSGRSFYNHGNASVGHVPPTLKIASAVSGSVLNLASGTPLSPIPATPLFHSDSLSPVEGSGRSPSSFGRESWSNSSVSDYETPPQTPEDDQIYASAFDTKTGLQPSSSGFLRPRRSSLMLYLPSNKTETPQDTKGKARQVPQPTRQPSFVSIVMPQTPSVVKSEYEAHTTQAHHISHTHSQSLPLGRHRATSLSQPPVAGPSNTTAQDDAATLQQLPGPLGGRATLYNFAQPVVILGGLFIASTAGIVILISTVPTLHLPKTLVDVVDQASALKEYSRTSHAASFHIFFVLSCMFVWKQAFSIPGSLITNILFGSLYGVLLSTIVTSLLTAIGSLLCYLMARKTSPLVRYLMPKPLAFMQANIEKRTRSKADLFSYLLLLRLFPLLPYSALNVAGGVLDVPTSPFFWTLVLGSIPFNAVTTQVGDLLAAIPIKEATSVTGSLTSIWTPTLVLKLFVISLVSALPVLFKSQITAFLGGDLPAQLSQDDTQLDTFKVARRKASVEDGSDDDETIELLDNSSQSQTRSSSEDEHAVAETPFMPVGLSDLARGNSRRLWH